MRYDFPVHLTFNHCLNLGRVLTQTGMLIQALTPYNCVLPGWILFYPGHIYRVS